MAVKKSAKKTTAAASTGTQPKTRKPRTHTESVIITADQFMSGVETVKRAFETLSRIENSVSRRDDTPAFSSIGSTGDLRIKECAIGIQQGVAQNAQKPSGPGSVETLIAQVNQRSRQVLGQAESLRRSVRNEPAPSEQANAACESHGQLKDFLLGSLNMLAEIEYNLEALGSYILG